MRYDGYVIVVGIVATLTLDLIGLILVYACLFIEFNAVVFFIGLAMANTGSYLFLIVLGDLAELEREEYEKERKAPRGS